MRDGIDRLVAAVIAGVAGAALVLQLVLILRNPGSPLALVVRYFSFFTILSNIVVTGVCIAVALGRGWLRSPVARGAAALYIAVTAGIYAALLQGLVHLAGAGVLADDLLHKVVPALYVVAWLACAPHRLLRWTDVLRWLLFPLVYIGWVLLRGAVVHEYPYPFLDLTKSAGGVVAVHCVAMGVLFALLGLVLVAADRFIPARRRH